MASDFERFLGELTAGMGLPMSSPAPVTRTQRPDPSPFANATPPQQQAIQRASAGLPPDLVAQIAQLAASPVAQQMPRYEPPIDPNLMASTGMVGMPMQRQEAPPPIQAPKQEGNPFAAKEGEGYLLVEYDTATEQGTVIIAVPERYKDTLPANARLYGNGQVIPAEAKDAIAGNNQLLEQQSPEIQNGIVPPKKVVAESGVNREIVIVEDRQGNQHTIDATEEIPTGMKVIRRAGGEQSGEQVVATGSPTTTGVMTDEQAANARAQNTATVDAEGNVVKPEEELVVIPLAEVQRLDPVLGKQLEESGLKEYRSDMVYSQDPETGRIEAMSKEEYEKANPDPDATLEPMTTKKLREFEGGEAEANELEAAGIYVIPDGKMAVKRDGKWTIVTAADSPEGVQNVVYGGESKPLEDKSVFGGLDDLAGVPGGVFRGGMDILSALDKPRRWTNEQMGDVLYERASGNDVDLPGWDPLAEFILGAPETDLKPGQTKLTSDEGSIGEWAKANPDKVVDLYENGYDSNDDGVVDFTGGEAVFEYWIGQQNLFTRVAQDLAGDPLNIAPGGGAILTRGAAKVAGPTLARQIVSRTLDTTGRTLKLPDEIIDNLLSRGARGTYNTLTTEGVRTGLADKLASARLTGKIFQEAPQTEMSKSQQNVDIAVSTLNDQQRLIRPMDTPPTAGNLPPAPDTGSGPVTRTPRDPGPQPTPDAPVTPPTVVSSVDTPPIPREVIETLPPAQRALYDNWEQQPLGVADESPFSYREDGTVTTDWDFAGPRSDEEGRKLLALLEDDDYARRIIDESNLAIGQRLPDRWKFFVDSHDPKVRRFVQKERELQARSMAQKDARNGDFDYPHKALSAVNEARYIIDDLLPDFKQAFPDEAIPAYRFKNKAKGEAFSQADRDDALLEALVFGDADTSAAARRELGRRSAGELGVQRKNAEGVFEDVDTGDIHLRALMRTAEDYRSRYLDILDGRMPEPRVVQPTGTIPTAPVANAPVGDAPAQRFPGRYKRPGSNDLTTPASDDAIRRVEELRQQYLQRQQQKATGVGNKPAGGMDELDEFLASRGHVPGTPIPPELAREWLFMDMATPARDDLSILNQQQAAAQRGKRPGPMDLARRGDRAESNEWSRAGRDRGQVEPEGIMDAPLDVPEAPQRMGLGLQSDEAAVANKQVWNKTNGIFRQAARKNGIKDEWISAYARRKGYGSSADIPDTEMRNLIREIDRNPALMRDTFEAAFDAAAPKGVAGIEQMAPANIKTTWGMKKRDLQKNLGIDRSLQPRQKPFDEEHVRGIVDNYSGERMDPIIVKRGKDGSAYVVAGHNRLEAARRLSVDIPVRYTDAEGEALLRLSRDTNMQNLGMSNATVASSVKQMVDEGKSFEEIGRALKLSPDGIAKTPATMAERYYNFSFLREGSNLARLTDQGILSMEISANAGRGIRNGALDQAEVESLAFRVSDNRLNPKKFDDILKRAIRRSEEGRSTQMGGLLEGQNVSDNLRAAEDEVDDLWNQWRKNHDDLIAAESAAVRDRTAIARLQARRSELADELDISDAKIGMKNPTPEGYLSRDYQVDEAAPTSTARAVAPGEKVPFGDTSVVERTPEVRLDADGNPIRSMRDNPGAQGLNISQRQTPETRWAPKAVNQGSQPTAAVAVYGHPMGQWEFPNLNLASISNRINKKNLWGDAYGDRGDASFLPNADTPQMRERRSNATYMEAPEPSGEVRTVRGRIVPQGDWDAHVLSQKFDDGEAILDRWERLADEYETRGLTADQADARAADQVMADWGEQVLKDYDAKKGTDFHAKYVKELDRVTNGGKKEDRLTGTHAQIVATQRAIGDTNKATSVYDEYLGIMREMTLYNVLSGPRYIMTQVIGNTITAMITGNFGIIPRAFADYKSSYQQMSGVNNDVVMKVLGGIGDGELSASSMRKGMSELADQPAMILYDSTDRHMREWNIGGERGDIFNVVRDEVTDVGRPTKLHNLRLGSMNIGKRVDGVFANRAVRDMANAWDLSYRKAMYGHMLKQNNAGARIAMKARMMESMPYNLPTSEFNRMWDDLPEVFGSDRIRQVFGEVDAKWADRMARDWQSAIRKMDQDARDKTFKLFFSGYERNADKALRRVFFFHYWMSRATPLYTEALLRNPGVLNAYVKMLEEMEEQKESGRFGPAVNGFLNFMSTPFGYEIFIRPDAFLQTVFSLDDGSDFEPEGETFIGALMRHSPLMINPLIDSAANLIGLQGDTFPPDPLMIGQWTNLATNGTNFVKSHVGDESGSPTKNVYSDFLSWVRSHTSGLGGLEKIDMTDSTQYARRDINYFLMEVAEERGLDPLGVEAMAAMDDTDSPLYKEAFNRYSEMKMVEHGLRFFPLSAVMYPKVRQEASDETRWIVNTAEPGSSEREQAMNERAIAQTSDPEARKLALQQKEYTSLGKQDERDAYSTYNGILYGGLKEPVVIDGVAMTDWALFGMTEDERQTAADAWAEQSGNADKVETVRELRKEYRETHPEYDKYVTWRFSVSDYEGGEIGYWGDLAEGNDNAERYLSSVEDDTPDNIGMNLTSVTAYMQYMGIRPTIYDPNPISTNNGQGQPYNPAGSSDSGSNSGSDGGGSEEFTIEDDIAKYNEEMASFTEKYGNLQNMTPPMREATISMARDNGDDIPYLSGKAKDYYTWKDAQDPGTDTSIPAYEAWKEKNEPKDDKKKRSSVAPAQQQSAGGINELLALLQF